MRSRTGSLSIGIVAARAGVQAHVLRHWESVGLLAPDRDAGGRRVYQDADLVRIALIQRGKATGLGLPAIRALTQAGRVAERSEVLRRQIAMQEAQIRELTKSAALLRCAAGCTHDDPSQCAHVRAVLDAPLDEAGRLG
ncbi:MerR family transcriptional regulator [Luteipulveratus mongoliensis]|uniref:HTH merR-type domain-containing protein n=1 Tax=Luteipulveratus mongoliensis TaxID=571913 RepID=A0A0K1JR20_9MICO|nr:MerR family transcriptional regulator [Luteipulveratus mongoliensis]AKU19038.1 hypothetical protein VV02_17250 [Luteipulveratus mongoliensis]